MHFVTGCVMCGGPQTKAVGTWQWQNHTTTLHGITVSTCQHCGKRETAIPSIGPLIAFMDANPGVRDAAFIEAP